MENKPLETNPEELNVDSAEGRDDVSATSQEDADASGDDRLNYFNKIAGRDFKSVDDFEKHYKELSSFVGKNPKELQEKAEAFEKLSKGAQQTVDKAEREGSVTPEITQLKDKINEMELERHYPDAVKYMSLIGPLAKQLGISPKEAFENHLKDLITSKLEVDKAKEEEKNISVESKGRVSSSKSAKIGQLTEAIHKTDSQLAKEDLVREYLSE